VQKEMKVVRVLIVEMYTHTQTKVTFLPEYIIGEIYTYIGCILRVVTSFKDQKSSKELHILLKQGSNAI